MPLLDFCFFLSLSHTHTHTHTGLRERSREKETGHKLRLSEREGGRRRKVRRGYCELTKCHVYAIIFENPKICSALLTG